MRLNLKDSQLTIEQTAHYCQTSIRTLQKYFKPLSCHLVIT